MLFNFIPYINDTITLNWVTLRFRKILLTSNFLFRDAISCWNILLQKFL